MEESSAGGGGGGASVRVLTATGRSPHASSSSDDDGGGQTSSARAAATATANTRLREVTSHATWRVSSAKCGNDVSSLLQRDHVSYWQSDGSTPHWIRASFCRRVWICQLWLRLQHDSDESYTPAVLSIHVGDGVSVQPLAVSQGGEAPPGRISLERPQGWLKLGFSPRVPAFELEVVIHANHQNGRDCHVRGVRVWEGGASPAPPSAPRAKSRTAAPPRHDRGAPSRAAAAAAALRQTRRTPRWQSVAYACRHDVR